MSQALDLSLLKGSPEQRDAISAALLDTLKTRGVAKLKNHGLPEELISKMFDYVSWLKRRLGIAPQLTIFARPVSSSPFHWRIR
jgi:predicted membrane metal-binding protein